jgi:hypothetical protein
MADAVISKQIADSTKFTSLGLNLIVDGLFDCVNASLWAKP